MTDVIPAGLQRHVSAFTLPSGLVIRRAVGNARQGWLLDAGPDRYARQDGTVGGPPRHVAFENLGYPRGEDDLHTEADYQAVEAERDRLWATIIMPLDQAWQVARRLGADRPLPEEGDRVVLTSGEAAIVDMIDDYCGGLTRIGVTVTETGGRRVVTALDIDNPDDAPDSGRPGDGLRAQAEHATGPARRILLDAAQCHDDLGSDTVAELGRRL